MPRAGKYRHRVTIADKVEAKTSHFGFTPQAVVIASRIPANVRELVGRELERAQQIDARSTHEVETRFRTGVKGGQTLTYHDGRNGDRTFEIVAPPRDVDQLHRELQLFCREQTSAA